MGKEEMELPASSQSLVWVFFELNGHEIWQKTMWVIVTE
jgi:hypothetical protein